MSENEQENKQTDDKNDATAESNGNPTEENVPEVNTQETNAAEVTEEVEATQEPNNEIIEGTNNQADNEDNPPKREGEVEKELTTNKQNEHVKEDITSNATDKLVDKGNQNEGTERPCIV